MATRPLLTTSPEILTGPAPSVPSALELEVATASSFLPAVIVFETTVQEDGSTVLVDATGTEDHYITDIDNQPQDAGIELDNDTQYYWQLVATLTSTDTFSQNQSFTTVGEMLPTLTYPEDGFTVYALDFDFDWNVAGPTPSSVYWRIDLDAAVKGSFDGATPSEMGGDAENDNDTSASDGYAGDSSFDTDDLPSALSVGSTYSWRVATMWPVTPTGWVPQEIFDKDETDRLVSVSAVSEFSTVTVAVVPTLTYPIGGLTIYTIEPVLSWNVGGPFSALTFVLTISESGAGPVACTGTGTVSGISGLQYDTAGCASALETGKTYDWKVKSTDGTNTSADSSTGTFSIQGGAFAAASFPSYPIDELEIYTTAPTFYWYTASASTGLSFVVWYKERPGAAETTCTGVKAGGHVPGIGYGNSEGRKRPEAGSHLRLVRRDHG